MKLDHFIGRSVESVHRKKDGTGYAVHLEGDVRVGEISGDPPALNGLVLLRVTPDYEVKETTLMFGHNSEEGPVNVITVVTDDDYSLAAPGIEGEIFPGREVKQKDVLPPDPSLERVAERPLQAPETDAVAYVEGEGGK